MPEKGNAWYPKGWYSNYARRNQPLTIRNSHKILIIDLDVHQGNGTAQIFRNEDRVFTFSMHGAHNYPLQKEVSDLDLPLADGTDDATYLKFISTFAPPFR